jgi:hypothetical protein
MDVPKQGKAKHGKCRSKFGQGKCRSKKIAEESIARQVRRDDARHGKASAESRPCKAR